MVSRDKAVGIVALVIMSGVLTVVSKWQFEMIMLCIQNGEIYCLPFNMEKSHDLWYWHDVWFSSDFIAWLMVAVPLVILVVYEVEKSRSLEDRIQALEMKLKK